MQTIEAGRLKAIRVPVKLVILEVIDQKINKKYLMIKAFNKDNLISRATDGDVQDQKKDDRKIEGTRNIDQDLETEDTDDQGQDHEKGFMGERKLLMTVQDHTHNAHRNHRRVVFVKLKFGKVTSILILTIPTVIQDILPKESIKRKKKGSTRKASIEL